MTDGGGIDIARLPLSTELLLPLRRQETAESDLLGAAEGAAMWLVPLILFDMGLPSTVPPLMTVVRLGVDGGAVKSTASSSGIFLLPNFPFNAAVIGMGSSIYRPSLVRSWSALLLRLLFIAAVNRKS